VSALEALKRANTAPPPEDSVALRLSVLVAVLAAALGLVQQGVGGALAPLVVVGIPAGYVCSHLARHRPGYVRKALLGILATAALARFLSTAAAIGASGPAGLTALRLPLAELFLLVQVLHSFDLPARRDLLFSLLSSLALVLVGGVLSTSPAFGPYLAVWGTAGAVSLVLAHRSALRHLPALAVPTVAVPGWRREAWRSARAVAGATALALGAAAATFLVLPAAGSPQLLGAPANVADGAVAVPVPGGLANPGLGSADPSRAGRPGPVPRAAFGYFGFSRSLDLAARGRPDDTPVMRVRASRPDFWRGQTFDRWDGRQWTMSSERPAEVRNTAPFDLPPPPEDRFVQYLGEPFVQTFYLQRPQPNLIFAAYKADELYLPTQAVFALGDGTVRTGFQLDAGTVYTVVSRRPRVTEAVLRLTTPDSPLPLEAAARYTELPRVPSRVRDLAARVTAAAPTTYDKVLALENWMGTNTTYSLDVPALPANADAVDQFLFVDQRGFCEQIATSLVVMLRSLGIPARLAVGYAPGERNPFSGLYQVRARDAHAWAEVYFAKVGWQAFDPTAQVPLAGGSPAPATAPDVFSYLGRHMPAVPGWAPPAALAVAALALVGATTAEIRSWWRRRRRRPPRSWAAACLDRLEAAGARRGRPRSPWETAREYADALSVSAVDDPRLPTVIGLLEREQFSGQPVSDAERCMADAFVDELAGAGGGRHRS